MAKTKIAQTWHIDSPPRYLAHQLIFGQKIKGQGHRVKSAKSRDETAVRRRLAAMWRHSTRRRRTAGVSYELHSVEYPAYSFD